MCPVLLVLVTLGGEYADDRGFPHETTDKNLDENIS